MVSIITGRRKRYLPTTEAPLSAKANAYALPSPSIKKKN